MGDSQQGIGLPVHDLEQAGDVELQLRRILDSPVLRNSPVLQSFLRFVTERALHGRGDEINEYSIATQVFARSTDFDPAADTIVRTQAYRLRSKLQQYYSTIGSVDSVIIEIPKGHYVPVFRRNDAESGDPPVVGAEVPAIVRGGLSARWWKLAVSGLVVLVIFFLGWFTGSRGKVRTASPPTATRNESPVEAFWAGFLDTDPQPIVAFTNGQFLGTESGDLLRFPGGPVADRGTLMLNPLIGAKHRGRLYYEDDYTGVGEVLAAVAISNTLSRSNGPLLFKRSRLVTTYDLQHHNVIFLGSPAVNPILNELPQDQNFVYRSAKTSPVLWKSQFENMHPLDGEPPSYRLERNPQTGAIQADYATITLFSGIAPGRKVLVLAGLTTSGTQAAADGVTTLHGVTELAGKLGVNKLADPGSWPAAFQALMRVELSRGLDVIQSHPVASRVVAWKR